MKIKYTIVDCYNTIQQFKNVAVVTSQILNAKIDKMEANEPYQFTCNLDGANSALRLLTSNPNYGIRITSSDIDLAFIPLEYKKNINGTYSCTFISSVYKMRSEPVFNSDIFYTGSAIDFLSRLSSNFQFRLLGKDKNITLHTGVNHNLQILDDVIKQIKDWSWRENGIINVGTSTSPIYKTEILIGDFNELLYDLQEQNKILVLKKKNKIDNSKNSSEIFIKSLVEETNQNQFSHYYIIGDTGSGASQNSRVEFTGSDIGADYVNSFYPIIPIKLPSYTGEKTIYVIQNQDVNRDTVILEQKVISITANTTESIGQQIRSIYTLSQLKEVLYNLALDHIANQKNKAVYNLSISGRNIVLPLTPVRIQYKDYINLPDRRKQQIFDIDTVAFLRGLMIDINTHNIDAKLVINPNTNIKNRETNTSESYARKLSRLTNYPRNTFTSNTVSSTYQYPFLTAGNYDGFVTDMGNTYLFGNVALPPLSSMRMSQISSFLARVDIAFNDKFEGTQPTGLTEDYSLNVFCSFSEKTVNGTEFFFQLYCGKLRWERDFFSANQGKFFFEKSSIEERQTNLIKTIQRKYISGKPQFTQEDQNFITQDQLNRIYENGVALLYNAYIEVRNMQTLNYIVPLDDIIWLQSYLSFTSSPMTIQFEYQGVLANYTP